MKVKNELKNVSYIWAFSNGFRLTYLGAFIAVALATGFSLLIPVIIRFTIDTIIGGQPPGQLSFISEAISDRIWIAALAIVGLTILRGIFLFAKGKLSADASEGIAKAIKDTLYSHLQYVKFSYYGRVETGDLIQRCTSDVETIRKFLAVQLVEVVNILVMISAIAFLMFKMDPGYTVVALSLVPFIIAYSMYFFFNVRKAFEISDQSEGKLYNVIQENINGVRVVKAFANEQYEIEKFMVKNDDFKEKTYKLIKQFAYFWSVSDLMCLTQVALVLSFGVYWGASGRISLGTVVAFTTYEGMILWPIRQLGRVLSDFGKATISAQRLHEVLSEELDEDVSLTIVPDIKGDIAFENVSFHYGDGHEVLKDISFEIHKGETIGIIGPTGAGKSTLVQLINRLYDPTSGTIRIDGLDISTIEKKWLRRNVGLVLQEPFLYAKSIKKNIAIAGREFKDEEIFEAAHVASIHHKIMEFEENYETMVGEKGVSLSGGQKQRIAIARTIISNSPILIFDDSLSAVDTQTDYEIRKALKNRSKDHTTIIISHRINSIIEADKILVLEEGKVTGFGNHKYLLEHNELYRTIWEIQSIEDVV